MAGSKEEPETESRTGTEVETSVYFLKHLKPRVGIMYSKKKKKKVNVVF